MKWHRPTFEKKYSDEKNRHGDPLYTIELDDSKRWHLTDNTFDPPEVRDVINCPDATRYAEEMLYPEYLRRREIENWGYLICPCKNKAVWKLTRPPFARWRDLTTACANCLADQAKKFGEGKPITLMEL